MPVSGNTANYQLVVDPTSGVFLTEGSGTFTINQDGTGSQIFLLRNEADFSGAFAGRELHTLYLSCYTFNSNYTLRLDYNGGFYDQQELNEVTATSTAPEISYSWEHTSTGFTCSLTWENAPGSPITYNFTPPPEQAGSSSDTYSVAFNNTSFTTFPAGYNPPPAHSWTYYVTGETVITFTSIAGNGRPGTGDEITGTNLDQAETLQLRIPTINSSGSGVVAVVELTQLSVEPGNTILNYLVPAAGYTEQSSGDSIDYKTIIAYSTEGYLWHITDSGATETDTGLSLNLLQTTWTSISGDGTPASSGTIVGTNLDLADSLILKEDNVSIGGTNYTIQVNLLSDSVNALNTALNYTVDNSYVKIKGVEYPISFQFVLTLLDEISLFNLGDHALPQDTNLNVTLPEQTEFFCEPDLQECQFADQTWTFRSWCFEDLSGLEKGGYFSVGGKQFNRLTVWLCSDDCLAPDSHCVLLRTRDDRFFVTRCHRINYGKIPGHKCDDIYWRIYKWLTCGEACHPWTIGKDLDPVSVGFIVSSDSEKATVKSQIGEIRCINAWGSALTEGQEVVIFSTNKKNDFPTVLGPSGP